ncbi:hypothetical protein FJZ27_01830 [Candidatus Peribacteria bacterium]|nr:hypothetical protein [Candidatus Peribacteria bacterium]
MDESPEIKRLQILSAIGADSGDSQSEKLCADLGQKVSAVKRASLEVRIRMQQVLFFANSFAMFSILTAVCNKHWMSPAIAAGVCGMAVAEELWEKVRKRNAVMGEICDMGYDIEDHLSDLAAGDLLIRQQMSDRGVEYAALRILPRAFSSDAAETPQAD